MDKVILEFTEEIEDDHSLFDGCGVASSEEVEAPPVPKPEDKPKEEEKFSVRKGFSKKPSLPDQYLREGLWDKGPAQVKTFHLIREADNTAYNEMLRMTQPEGSPAIIIENDSPIFCEKEADFVVFFRYREILYRNLTIN